jgi:hypothetical protein
MGESAGPGELRTAMACRGLKQKGTAALKLARAGAGKRAGHTNGGAPPAG